MYKVFVNDLPMMITNEPTDFNGRDFSMLTKENLLETIDILDKKKAKDAFLYYKGKKDLVSVLKDFLPLEVAAGGMVLNVKNKILFIKRNGFWDLPKGKVDPGETLEEAALREVEEETGVNKLILDCFIKTTYHILKRKGVRKLKEVHWYAMHTTYNGKLEPQQEEGITKVKWKGKKKTKKALKNTYANIDLLFNSSEAYFKIK